MSFDIINKALPLMMKYKDCKFTEAEINIEKYDNGVVIEILTDNPVIGDMVTDMFNLVTEMSKDANSKVTFNTTDHRVKD